MKYALLPVCALLGACSDTHTGYGGGGLSNGIVENYMGRSYDAQIAPALRGSGTCNDGEIAVLRQTTIEMSRATNSLDYGAVLAAGNRLHGISPRCRTAYEQVSAQICRQSAIDNWRPGNEPYESALARARNCG